MKLKALFSAMCLMAASSGFNASAGQVDSKDVEQAVRDAMLKFDIPGVAIAVVENDKVVMAKGFGVRHLTTQAPVNADTLFGIASNSKAFTAAALAMLVDEGKITWDDKVIQHIPEFKLHDAYATREMTIRDLLSHRSGLGLGAGDLMIWPDTNKSVAELIEGVSHLKPVSSFRTQYAYNNLMFVMAGEVVARVSGLSWQDYVEQKMMKPLAMTTSRAGFSRIAKNNANWATGHIPMDGKLTPFFVNYLEDFRGAGAIASNVNEMSQWLLTQLDGGKMPNGEPLFSADQQKQMWHPHIMRMASDASFDSHRQQFRGYGLGWSIEDYYGYKKVGHGGGILGMVSQVALIPQKKLGVVILSNQQAYPALTAVINEVFEDALDLAEKDYVQEAAKQFKKYKKDAYAKAGAEQLDTVQAALPAQNYTGTLTSDWYGDVIVEYVANELRIDFTHTKLLKGKLEHHTGNSFIVRWDNKLLEADSYIHFEIDKAQRVKAASMEYVNPHITDFSFDFHNLELKAKQ